MKDGRYIEITNRINATSGNCRRSKSSKSYAPIGVSPDGFLFRKWERTEEPDEGNLHVRICGESAGQPVLLPGIYAAANNLNKQYMTISETLFDGENPAAHQYIKLCKREFDSPLFDALKTYLIEHDKSASYIQSILDIPYTDAKAIHTVLI